jgi:hypothetical protein
LASLLSGQGRRLAGLARSGQEWTRLKEDDNGNDLAFSLVIDSELFRLDSVVRWLDAAEGRLRRALAGGWTPAQALAAAKVFPGLPTRPKMGIRR